MNLHLPTVLLFAGLLTATITVGLGLMAWRDRSAYLWHWTAAMVSTVLGMVLFSMRGLWPDVLTILVANLMLLGNLLFTLSGYDRLFGRRTPWRWMVALAVAQALAYAWFTWGYNHFPTRILTFNGTLAVLSIASMAVLWDERRRWGVVVLLLPLAAHGMQALLGLVRVALVLLGLETGQNLDSVTQPHAVVIMLNSAAVLALVFGFMTLHAGRLHDELDNQAVTDVLTQLSNRRGFERQLAIEWRRHLRHGHPLAVLMVDIDHFKRINDAHGHAAGDAALRHLGRVLAEHVRPYDLCARTGGEEFRVVLPGAHLEEAQLSAERLRQAELRFGEGPQGEPWVMTLSIGVSLTRAGDLSGHDAVRRADAALYRAKQAGRNRVEVN
jgi:diguanylate cyclase (GGDEF)-like protein